MAIGAILGGILSSIGIATGAYNLFAGIRDAAMQRELQGLSLEAQIEGLEGAISEAEYLGGTGEYDPTLEGFREYLEGLEEAGGGAGGTTGAGEPRLGSYEIEAQGYLENITGLRDLGAQEEQLISEQLAAIQSAAGVSAAAGGIRSSSASVRALNRQSRKNAALDIEQLWHYIHYGGGGYGEGIYGLEDRAQIAINNAAIQKGYIDTYEDVIDIYDRIDELLNPEPAETDDSDAPENAQDFDTGPPEVPTYEGPEGVYY